LRTDLTPQRCADTTPSAIEQNGKKQIALRRFPPEAVSNTRPLAKRWAANSKRSAIALGPGGYELGDDLTGVRSRPRTVAAETHNAPKTGDFRAFAIRIRTSFAVAFAPPPISGTTLCQGGTFNERL